MREVQIWLAILAMDSQTVSVCFSAQYAQHVLYHSVGGETRGDTGRQDHGMTRSGTTSSGLPGTSKWRLKGFGGTENFAKSPEMYVGVDFEKP